MVAKAKQYVCMAEYGHGPQFIGVLEGEPQDVQAYCEQNHKAYRYDITELSPIIIPPNYKADLAKLLQDRNKASDEIKRIDALLQAKRIQ